MTKFRFRYFKNDATDLVVSAMDPNTSLAESADYTEVQVAPVDHIVIDPAKLPDAEIVSGKFDKTRRYVNFGDWSWGENDGEDAPTVSDALAVLAAALWFEQKQVSPG